MEFYAGRYLAGEKELGNDFKDMTDDELEGAMRYATIEAGREIARKELEIRASKRQRERKKEQEKQATEELKLYRSQTRAMWLSVGISILALIISIIALCSTAKAHPGSVDRGHTNRKTGKYHPQQHKK